MVATTLGKRRARARSVAVAFIAASTLGLTAGLSQAQIPDWAQQCLQTTMNPWILSQYCETHNDWDRYYCQCSYQPQDVGGSGSGGAANDDGRRDDDRADLDDVRDGDNQPDDTGDFDSSPCPDDDTAVGCLE